MHLISSAVHKIVKATTIIPELTYTNSESSGHNSATKNLSVEKNLAAGGKIITYL